MTPPSPPWLLLVHNLPPKPSYLRVKIWRHLQQLGAVPVKNSVYALPRTDASLEHFTRILREIVAGGGEAFIAAASLTAGLQDGEVRQRFLDARTRDYREIAALLRALDPGDARALGRLRRRLEETRDIDFFEAPGRVEAERLLEEVTRQAQKGSAPKRVRPQRLTGRTWVTRSGIRVDRIASAWLIRRFIDRKAKLKFVADRAYQPQPGELRFDMYDGEFTHQGDRCTFEVLVDEVRPADPTLGPIAAIVHDIDLKDEKYGRPETAGIERLIAGIARAHPDDKARLARGSALFDDLYAYFESKAT
jgi:hypothetical protein